MMDIFDIRKIEKEMNKLFIRKSPFNLLSSEKERFSVKEDNDDIEIEAFLPGMERKDVIINTTKNSIRIRAHKKSELKIEKKGFYKQETGYKTYDRFIRLPRVIPEEAKIEFKNGLLKIKIPKANKKLVKVVAR